LSSATEITEALRWRYLDEDGELEQGRAVVLYQRIEYVQGMVNL